MLIVFENLLSQYVKKITTMRIKKMMRSHWRSVLSQQHTLILLCLLPKNQGAKEDRSDGSQLELVRPVTLTGQTGLTRN